MNNWKEKNGRKNKRMWINGFLTAIQNAFVWKCCPKNQYYELAALISPHKDPPNECTSITLYCVHNLLLMFFFCSFENSNIENGIMTRSARSLLPSSLFIFVYFICSLCALFHLPAKLCGLCVDNQRANKMEKNARRHAENVKEKSAKKINGKLLCGVSLCAVDGRNIMQLYIICFYFVRTQAALFVFVWL